MHFLCTKFYLSVIYIRITSHNAMCHSWKNTEFEVRGSRFKYELCQEGWQLWANYSAWVSGFSLSLETTPATPGRWLCEWAQGKCSDTHGSPKEQLSLPTSIYMGNVHFSDRSHTLLGGNSVLIEIEYCELSAIRGSAVGSQRRDSPVVGKGLLREVTLELSLERRTRVLAKGDEHSGQRNWHLQGMEVF